MGHTEGCQEQGWTRLWGIFLDLKARGGLNQEWPHQQETPVGTVPFCGPGHSVLGSTVPQGPSPGARWLLHSKPHVDVRRHSTAPHMHVSHEAGSRLPQPVRQERGAGRPWALPTARPGDPAFVLSPLGASGQVGKAAPAPGGMDTGTGSSLGGHTPGLEVRVNRAPQGTSGQPGAPGTHAALGVSREGGPPVHPEGRRSPIKMTTEKDSGVLSWRP